jgi:RimJ/RimL family protein N-acetyltransferase
MLQTKNFILREVVESDTDFILELINQPAWKKYISDHSIETPDQAREYIKTKFTAMYKDLGFGLWAVESISEKMPVGLCGLLKRESLEHIDLGFAFLPRYWGKGFAYETSVLCLQYAFEHLSAPKVYAITVPSNDRSVRLLECLGFSYKENYSHPGSSEVLSLYEVGPQVFRQDRT